MRLLGLLLVALVMQGCSYATVKLMYSDAKVVYEDARFVVHEIREARDEAKGN